MKQDHPPAALDRATLLEIEAVMSQVQNVISVRVVPDKGGQIAEVHALTDAGRSPKQIVRDLESVLMSRWGIRVDHKKISIAQIGDEPSGPSEAPARLSIGGVELKNQGLRSRVRVDLVSENGSALSGEVEGPATSGNRLRLVAQATLSALGSLAADSWQFVLEDARVEVVSRREVVVVCVTVVGRQSGEETFLGTCQVQRDETEATIKATLNALNRRLGRLGSTA